MSPFYPGENSNCKNEEIIVQLLFHLSLFADEKVIVLENVSYFRKIGKILWKRKIGGEVISRAISFPPTYPNVFSSSCVPLSKNYSRDTGECSEPSLLRDERTYIAASEFRVPPAEHEIACNCRLAFAIFTPFSRCTTAPCLPRSRDTGSRSLKTFEK